MAKTTEEQFQEFVDDVLKVATKDLTSKQAMNAIGKDAVKLIRLRTRLGKGTKKEGGSEFKLDALSAKYRERRKALKKAGVLSGKTNANKSNLTLTGSMLDSIFQRARPGEVTISVKGNKNKLKASVAETGVPKKNIPARPFLHLSGRQTKELRRTIRRILNKSLDRVFK